MRIRTDGDFEHRQTTIDDAAEVWGCNRTEAIMLSCRFARTMLGTDASPGALDRTLAHPDMTAELADVLDVPQVSLTYQIETDVETDPG